MMTHTQMVAAFNEWMRLYIEKPETFNREFEVVSRFLEDQAGGGVPTYGDRCAALLVSLVPVTENA